MEGFDITTIAIGGIALIPMVAGLVEFSRKFGNKGRGLIVLAFALGALVAGVAGALSLGLLPEVVVPWIKVVVMALAGGLAACSACGLVDLGKRLTGK